MNKTKIYLVVSSLLIWLPVIIVISKMSLGENKSIIMLLGLSVLIFPLISAGNLALVIHSMYKARAVGIFNVIIILVNILFLLIGRKYLQEIMWLI